jgi:hypothetical protein
MGPSKWRKEAKYLHLLDGVLFFRPVLDPHEPMSSWMFQCCPLEYSRPVVTVYCNYRIYLQQL